MFIQVYPGSAAHGLQTWPYSLLFTAHVTGTGGAGTMKAYFL